MKPTAKQQRSIERVVNDYLLHRLGLPAERLVPGSRLHHQVVSECMDEVKASGIILPIIWFFVQWWIKRKIIQILEGS